MRDAFLWGSEWAAVWADVVAFPSKEVAEVGAFGAVGALGADSKKTHSSIGVLCGEVGWGDSNSFGFPEGVSGVAWYGWWVGVARAGYGDADGDVVRAGGDIRDGMHGLESI